MRHARLNTRFIIDYNPIKNPTWNTCKIWFVDGKPPSTIRFSWFSCRDSAGSGSLQIFARDPQQCLEPGSYLEPSLEGGVNLKIWFRGVFGVRGPECHGPLWSELVGGSVLSVKISYFCLRSMKVIFPNSFQYYSF